MIHNFTDSRISVPESSYSVCIGGRGKKDGNKGSVWDYIMLEDVQSQKEVHEGYHVYLEEFGLLVKTGIRDVHSWKREKRKKKKILVEALRKKWIFTFIYNLLKAVSSPFVMVKSFDWRLWWDTLRIPGIFFCLSKSWYRVTSQRRPMSQGSQS